MVSDHDEAAAADLHAAADRLYAEARRLRQIANAMTGCNCAAAAGTRQALCPDPRTAYQAETLPQARRHGYEWTGRELELAARADLTVRQIALMTGRTYAAVINARQKLRRDPVAS